MHRSYLPKSYILGIFPPVQLHHFQGMCQSLNKRQGDMKLKAPVGHNHSSVGNGGMLHRTRPRNVRCQQTVDGLSGSMCVQFSATYLRSLKHRLVYNTSQICSK